VLQSLTAVRIRGEFITGNDEAFLDNVVLAAPVRAESPALSIRLKAPGRIELSWPATASDHVLQVTDPLAWPSGWSTIDTGTATSFELGATNGPRFFRLLRNR
jgi:hypothetical protein